MCLLGPSDFHLTSLVYSVETRWGLHGRFCSARAIYGEPLPASSRLVRQSYLDRLGVWRFRFRRGHGVFIQVRSGRRSIYGALGGDRGFSRAASSRLKARHEPSIDPGRAALAALFFFSAELAPNALALDGTACHKLQRGRGLCPVEGYAKALGGTGQHRPARIAKPLPPRKVAGGVRALDSSRLE